MAKNSSWKMPLCILLALAVVSGTRAQEDDFFAELPPAVAPEVFAATAPEVPSAAPALTVVGAASPVPAEGPAAAPVPSQEAIPVVSTQVDLSDTPFSSIQVCWPFNTYIQPGDNYTLDLQAEDVVLQAIIVNVTADGTLQLSTEGNFRTAYPVVAIVSMPFYALSGVVVQSPSAEVTVGPGFVAETFTASAPFTSQDLHVLGLTADALRVQSSGLGSVYVDGNISNATVVASGSGDVYLIGLEDTADLNLAGTVTAYIQATNDSAIIEGQASGINTVLYQMGSCFITSPFLFGSPCQQTNILPLPTIDPLWTCGLRVTGNFTCPRVVVLPVRARAPAGLLPLAAPLRRFPSPPSPSLPPPLPIPSAVAVSPPVFQQPLEAPPPFLEQPVIPLQPSPPPSSPSANIVSRVGSGPQFAGTSGSGTQIANAVSGPGLQQQNIGTNTPVPDIFNTPGFTDSFGSIGRRRMQQAFPAGGQSTQSSSGVRRASTSKSTRPFPCFYDALGGFDALRLFQNGP